MPIRNPERAIATLTGEVHGLFMALQVLAKSHPYPNSALRELDNAEQLGLAALEPYPIDDAALAGFQHAIAGIRIALEANPQYNPD